MAGTRIAVQGFGNVGSFAARFFAEAGAKVVAVGDVSGGAFNRDGLNIRALLDYARTNGSVAGFAGAEKISAEDVLTCDCDVLVPAALQCVLTKHNAEKVRAKVVIEGANLPTTPEADEILHRKGVAILPDILTNAGGVTVSYFEWAQNLQQTFWDEDRVNQEMHKILTRAYREVADKSSMAKIPMRASAYTIAVERVARAEKLRGI